MKSSTSSNRSNVLILMAMFGVMLVMSPRPARAQQDVDPTYYDPWAPATPVVAHVVSHANATKTTPEAKQEKALTEAQSAPATKEKAKLTSTSSHSTSSQKTAKLHKTATQAKQS